MPPSFMTQLQTGWNARLTVFDYGYGEHMFRWESNERKKLNRLTAFTCDLDHIYFLPPHCGGCLHIPQEHAPSLYRQIFIYLPTLYQ